MSDGPRFGHADLTNCERELIHLAGSVQPHGILLVVDPDSGRILQASGNVELLWGRPALELLGLNLEDLGEALQTQAWRALREASGADPQPFACSLSLLGRNVRIDAVVHRHPGGGVVVELEPLFDSPAERPAQFGPEPASVPAELLTERLQAAVTRISESATVGTLCDRVVQAVRELTGYDRVMVYRFDPDGHGKVIAEARHARLESLLGHHYPASDIPQRARELYLRNRVRVLVDVDYAAVPLEPPRLPDGSELDMSMCHLRSMSPLHLQYLKNMGVTGTLVVSLLREGRLWGLIAAHHYAPRNIRRSLRVASELIAEVTSTRIAAIENYAHAQIAMLVRRLEHRLIEATSTEGDWRFALFRNPRTLLQPLEATGAALCYEGEILTTGEVPSTPELRQLVGWIDDRPSNSLFECSAVAAMNPALASLTPIASGVLAIRLSTGRPDYLLWFRKEQLQTVTWAGDPNKPMIGNDPSQLSPRRSFAAWSEIVRGTALPWSRAELALARAVGAALVDIIVQVHAVRLLIAEHQLAQIHDTVRSSHAPVAIADGAGRVLFVSEAFRALAGDGLQTLDAIAGRFTTPQAVRAVFAGLNGIASPWHGELALRREGQDAVPVLLRAEVVPTREGAMLGAIVTLTDLSDTVRTAAAREHLEQVLHQAALSGRDARRAQAPDGLIGAILSNASIAAMDIADGPGSGTVAPLLEELEASTRRAALLYARLKSN